MCGGILFQFCLLGSPVHQMCMRRKKYELRSELKELLYIVTKRKEMWRKTAKHTAFSAH